MFTSWKSVFIPAILTLFPCIHLLYVEMRCLYCTLPYSVILGSTHRGVCTGDAPMATQTLAWIIDESFAHGVWGEMMSGFLWRTWTLRSEQFKAGCQTGRWRCVWLWDFADSLQRQRFLLVLLRSLTSSVIFRWEGCHVAVRHDWCFVVLSSTALLNAGLREPGDTVPLMIAEGLG